MTILHRRFTKPITLTLAHTHAHTHALTHTHLRTRTHAHAHTLTRSHTHTHTFTKLFSIQQTIKICKILDLQRGFPHVKGDGGGWSVTLCDKGGRDPTFYNIKLQK